MTGPTMPRKSQQESLFDLLEQRAKRNREKLTRCQKALAARFRNSWSTTSWTRRPSRSSRNCWTCSRARWAQNMSQQMKDQIQGMSPDQMAAMQEMMRQINQMIRDKLEGLEPDFDGFMEQFGGSFGPNPPQSFEELMEMLQQQLAQMQSMMESMSPKCAGSWRTRWRRPLTPRCASRWPGSPL